MIPIGTLVKVTECGAFLSLPKGLITKVVAMSRDDYFGGPVDDGERTFVVGLDGGKFGYSNLGISGRLKPVDSKGLRFMYEMNGPFIDE